MELTCRMSEINKNVNLFNWKVASMFAMIELFFGIGNFQYMKNKKTFISLMCQGRLSALWWAELSTRLEDLSSRLP